VIKSRRWEGHAARMGDMRNMYEFQTENLKGRDHLGDVRVVGNIILK
jgi:hypothetical protein